MSCELGVIFDLDGVVIDVRNTYRQAYVAGVMWALRADAKLAVQTPLFTVDDVHALKRHPGFNAPRDTVAFFARACLCALAAVEPGQPVSANAVRRLLDSLAGDGGLDEWSTRTLAGLSDDMGRSWVVRTEAGLRALQRTHEAYAGSAATLQVYGHPPLGELDGLCRNDKLLMRVDRKTSVPVAVYTGRTRGEALMVMRRFALFADVPAERLVTTDDDAYKPDPAPLARLIDRLDCERAIYIGDTAADRDTVRAYGAIGRTTPCALAQVVTPEQAAWPEAVASGLTGDGVLHALGL